MEKTSFASPLFAQEKCSGNFTLGLSLDLTKAHDRFSHGKDFMNRLRILLLAQQNNPDWISVPLVGFQHSSALAKMHEVTLVTHYANEEAILKQNVPFQEVLPISLGGWEAFYTWCFIHVFRSNHGSQLLTAFRIPFYWAFEQQAFRRFKRRLQAKEFDLVLRLTPVAPVSPSLFAKRCRKLGIPFIIGPVNGGLPWPKGYSQAEKSKEWVSKLRFLYRMLPYARSTYRDASAVITGSSETYFAFREHQEKLFFIPENGIQEHTVIDRLQNPSRQGPLRLIFVGRLVGFKGADLVISAAADLLRDRRVRLTIVGDGEERPNLEKLAKSLDVDVSFLGMISHHETMAQFRESDVLVFPSVREFGGGVVYEALALGCVPVVSSYGGPGDIVQDGRNGFSIPMRGEDYTKLQIKRILEKLERQPEILAEMASEGQRYARQELSWRGKAEKMTEIFNWTLGRGPKPSFPPPRTLI